MKQEDAQKWLAYQNEGVKPTRYKLAAVVYASHGISESISFSIGKCELTLKPMPQGNPRVRHVDGLMPAFICETVSDASVHRGGNNFDIQDNLDRILPLTGVRFRLSIDFNQWEEYEGQWIEAPSGGGELRVQVRSKRLPNENIHNIVQAYEAISHHSNNRAKKALAMRERLKEALELEEVSPRFGFLSYYSVIEIIADDLAKHNQIESGDLASRDIAKFSLSTKGSQRTKIYFLLRAINNAFDLDECISLADTRNDLAHGELHVERGKLELCKRIAYWASEQFVMKLAGSNRLP